MWNFDISSQEVLTTDLEEEQLHTCYCRVTLQICMSLLPGMEPHSTQ